MNEERRYSEEEISAIFKQAAKDQEAAEQNREKSDGLTLSELQEIGADAGITSEMISKAAATVESVGDALSERETYMGIPISASHEVELSGFMSDADWNRLVIEMREMFHAHGKLEQSGDFRSWRNGNLRISVEPTDKGHRIRMRTRKGGARNMLFGSLVGAVVMFSILVFGSIFSAKGFSIAGLVLMIGFGGMWYNAWRIPRWSRLRNSQMETLASMARKMADRAEKKAQVQTQTQPQLEETATGVLNIEEESKESESVHAAERKRTH